MRGGGIIGVNFAFPDNGRRAAKSSLSLFSHSFSLNPSSAREEAQSTLPLFILLTKLARGSKIIIQFHSYVFSSSSPPHAKFMASHGRQVPTCEIDVLRFFYYFFFSFLRRFSRKDIVIIWSLYYVLFIPKEYHVYIYIYIYTYNNNYNKDRLVYFEPDWQQLKN